MLKHTGRLLFALSLSALLLACSSKKDEKDNKAAEPKATEPKAAEPKAAEPKAADAPPSGLIPTFEKLAEKACACKDKACANGVQDELGKLTGELATVQDNEKQQIGVVMQKLTKCIQDAQK